MITSKSCPLLLDLFCGAGGASMGYFRAGFDVVGVDRRYVRNYPFTLLVGDAIRIMDDLLDGKEVAGRALSDFTAIHASPPPIEETIRTVRERLLTTGMPCIIESSPDAEQWMNATVMLCGTMFDMTAKCRDGIVRELRRHRIFETTFPVDQLECQHRVSANLASRSGHCQCGLADLSDAMKIMWMDDRELSLATPPKYTTYIGHQLLRQLERRIGASQHAQHQTA